MKPIEGGGKAFRLFFPPIALPNTRFSGLGLNKFKFKLVKDENGKI
jgi:hypothetical protein